MQMEKFDECLVIAAIDMTNKFDNDTIISTSNFPVSILSRSGGVMSYSFLIIDIDVAQNMQWDWNTYKIQ